MSKDCGEAYDEEDASSVTAHRVLSLVNGIGHIHTVAPTLIVGIGWILTRLTVGLGHDDINCLLLAFSGSS